MLWSTAVYDTVVYDMAVYKATRLCRGLPVIQPFVAAQFFKQATSSDPGCLVGDDQSGDGRERRWGR